MTARDPRPHVYKSPVYRARSPPKRLPHQITALKPRRRARWNERLLTGFVERFYFTLRHGLTTLYSAYKQRLAAQLCYRTIQVTMILSHEEPTLLLYRVNKVVTEQIKS